jgi:cellulose synthase/poly-beta-1,6-N-acetylglucosamine synthase-like glycosyltransferase
MILVSAALWMLAIPALLVSCYLLLLAMASRRREPPEGVPSLRFDVIVPAHDEESGIARTVRSLLAVDYPPGLRRVFVIADNCQDATAARAEAAGATVLVRTDPSRRGKGYALARGFDRVLADGVADAVVVLDADSVASPNLLTAFAARLQRGARAVQAGSRVLNAGDSWRTQLMELGLSLFNGLRSLARENLDLSCGLRGNGMCLSTHLLREHPWRAFSIVEDLEYGLALGRAGIRVAYAGEATASSAMTSSSRAAGAQRRRWELGRLSIARRLARPLLLEALRKRSLLLLDLAFDLLVPPLSLLALAVLIGCAASLAAGSAAISAWLLCAACLAAYVLRGWALSGIGLRGIGALLHAPWYVIWKLAVLWRGPGGWVRTPREEAAA